jgi:hypothetical protein
MDIYLIAPPSPATPPLGSHSSWAADHHVEGRYLRQRLAALLRQIGRHDQIALSHDGYVEIALRLATEILTRPTAEQRGAMRSVARRLKWTAMSRLSRLSSGRLPPPRRRACSGCRDDSPDGPSDE